MRTVKLIQYIKERKQIKKKRRLWYKILSSDSKVSYNVRFFLAFSVEFLRILFTYLFIGIILLLVIFIIFYNIKYKDLIADYRVDAQNIINASNPDDFRLYESSTIYDNKGNKLASLFSNSDFVYLSYNNIPKNVVNAFVSVEDKSFWSNRGINNKGIVDIMLNLLQLKTSTGIDDADSTITQHLVRGTFLTNNISLECRVKEIFMAYELTKKYSKEDIFEYYANNLNFANGVYGIGSASKAYFNTDIDKLSLSQIAYLCAIPANPEVYNPYVNSEKVISRRDTILTEMLNSGYITKQGYDTAIAEKIILDKPKSVFNDYETTYAIDCAVRYLMKLNGFKFKYKFSSMLDFYAYQDKYKMEYSLCEKDLRVKGYKIYTSLDTQINTKLQNVIDTNLAFNTEIEATTDNFSLQGALVAMDNKTRKVVSIVGGRSERNPSSVYSTNRAFQVLRQPGDALSPLVLYTPLLDMGYNADSMVESLDIASAKQMGIDLQSSNENIMSLRDAISSSNSGVAWQLFNKLTPKKGLSYLSKMHFSDTCPSNDTGSISEGHLEKGVSVVEMAGAYSTLINHGTFIEPTCIVSILDRDNKEIYKTDKSVRVYSAKASDDMIDILRGTEDWTVTKNIDTFGKLGTLNFSEDSWVCGGTPYYSVSVWIGHDKPKVLSNTYSKEHCVSIWKNALHILNRNKSSVKFKKQVKDKSYKKVRYYNPKGYYGYLKNRKDSEILSDGYSVADYRSDRILGESVYAIMDKINDLNMSSSSSQVKLKRLYKKGLSIVNTIYSSSYRVEMEDKLSKLYKEKVK